MTVLVLPLAILRGWQSRVNELSQNWLFRWRFSFLCQHFTVGQDGIPWILSSVVRVVQVAFVTALVCEGTKCRRAILWPPQLRTLTG